MMDRKLKMALANVPQQRDADEPTDKPSTTKVTVAAPSVNATAIFKAGMLDLEKRMNAAGDSSSVTCFGREKSPASSIGRTNLGPSSSLAAPHAAEGKTILRTLSAFACISLKASSPSSSSSSSSSARRKGSLQGPSFLRKSTTAAAASAPADQRTSQVDQRILLRIVMWGGPNTLLLLAPFDAPAECVIEMVLDSYVNGLQECNDFELFCAHCNSPALHPKQLIGSVGSRHFLLCKKGPQISGFSFFNSYSQITLFSQHSSSQTPQGSKHSHSSHSYSSHSHGSHTIRRRRSLSQGNFSLLQSSSLAHSSHKRSNSWWNPVQCLTVGQH